MKIKIICFLILQFSYLYGQSAGEAIHIVEYPTGPGARALGLGGAYVAVSEDFSATYWNSAGLTQIRKMEFSGSLSHSIYNNDVSYFGTSTNQKTNYTKLNSFGFVFPVPTYRGSLVFALGYNRIKDFDSALQLKGLLIPDSVAQGEDILEEGSLNEWVIAGAVDVTENFSFGATFSFLSGTNDYSVHFEEDDRDFDYYTFRYGTNDNTLVSDYNAIGLKLGGLFRVAKSLRIGAQLNFPTRITVEDNWSSDEYTIYDNDSTVYFSDTGSNRYTISSPYGFDLGGSIKIQNLLFSGSLNFQDWSQVKFRSPSEYLLENPIIRNSYESTIGYGLGAEYAVNPLNLKLRGGYRVIPSPLKGASADMDHKYISFGSSFLLDKQILIDVTYFRGYWNRFSSDIFATGVAKESVEFDKVLVTISYRF